MNKIALTTSSFAVHSRGPLELLESNGFTWTVNPHGRTLKPNEIRDLLKGCVGVIAGLGLPGYRAALEFLAARG